MRLCGASRYRASGMLTGGNGAGADVIRHRKLSLLLRLLLEGRDPRTARRRRISRARPPWGRSRTSHRSRYECLMASSSGPRRIVSTYFAAHLISDLGTPGRVFTGPSLTDQQIRSFWEIPKQKKCIGPDAAVQPSSRSESPFQISALAQLESRCRGARFGRERWMSGAIAGADA